MDGIDLRIRNLKPYELTVAILAYNVTMTLLSWANALIERKLAPKDQITHAIGFDGGSEAYEEEYEEEDDDDDDDECEENHGKADVRAVTKNHTENIRRIGFEY